MIKTKKDAPDKVFGFRWDNELVSLWEEVASRFSRRDPASNVAREVLEEFIACFLPDEKLEKLGLIAYRNYPPPRIDLALQYAKRMRHANGDTQCGDLLGKSTVTDERQGGNRQGTRSRNERRHDTQDPQ